MEDFESQVQRVLKEIHTDVVFRLNFKNCANIAIEEILGTGLDASRTQEIIKEVRARLKKEIVLEEHHRQQVIAWRKELEAASGKELGVGLKRQRGL